MDSDKRIEPNEIFDAIRSRAEAAEDTRSELHEILSELTTMRHNLLDLSSRDTKINGECLSAARVISEAILNVELRIIKSKKEQE